MKRFARGLVVGKFCPLHRGHEYLINQALAQCESVVILSYTNPEFAGMARAVRARWLEALFPESDRWVIDQAWLDEVCRSRGIRSRMLPPNDAPAEDHRTFVAWLCDGVIQARPDAVFTSEAYGDGFAESLGQAFSKSGGRRISVTHVCVDIDRMNIPTSGSLVRSDVHAHRWMLPPIVYANFIRRVCILGGESSGKTTLAQQLADELQSVWVPEYGRDLWVKRGGVLKESDMVHIANRQTQMEDEALLHANRWLVCDTSPLTTLFYATHLFGRADPELEAAAARRYDLTLLCEPDFPFAQDGTRAEPALRAQQHNWYLNMLDLRRVPYRLVRGSIKQRCRSVVAYIAMLDAGNREFAALREADRNQ